MGDRWAFLTFCRNDGDAVVASIDRIRTAVDEVVVVDSSDSNLAGPLTDAVVARGGRVVRVLPLGNVDLLRPFGVAQVRSEHTVYLDADERPSDGLVHGLRSLDGPDAYVVARREVSLRAITQHLRIFRTSQVTYHGRSHLFPEVVGTVAAAPPEVYLVHDARYDRYFEDRTIRYRSILMSEWLDRPFDRGYLREAFTVPTGARPFRLLRPFGNPDDHRPLSPAGVRLAIEGTGLLETFSRRSPRWGRFQRAYGLVNARAWGALAPGERDWWQQVAAEVRSAGGLRSYLGLDDVAYLTELTRGFPWDRGGPEVLSALIEYRHSHGQRRPAGPWVAAG